MTQYNLLNKILDALKSKNLLKCVPLQAITVQYVKKELLHSHAFSTISGTAKHICLHSFATKMSHSETYLNNCNSNQSHPLRIQRCIYTRTNRVHLYTWRACDSNSAHFDIRLSLVMEQK